MSEKLKKLGRHSLVYGIGNILAMAGSFLLIPLYTHVLTPGDYGVIELLNRSSDILMIVMFLGIRQAFIRLYFDHDDQEWHKKVAGTTIVCILFSTICVVAACYPFSTFFADKLFSNTSYALFIKMLLVWVPLELLINIGLAFLQIQMKSVLYVTLNAIKLFLLVISNVVLLYFYQKGIFGFLLSNIWVAAIIAVPFLLFFVHWSRLQLSMHVFKELFKFGLPLLPATVFMFIINNSDRYLLKMYSDLEAVGIYALAFKIGMFGTMILMEPFGKVWAPFLFENYKKDDGPATVSSVFMLAITANVTVALLISIIAPSVIRMISAEAFHNAYGLVPFLCAASICYSMTSIADAGILISKKTYFKPIVNGVCCVIIIALNMFLIPRYGAYGAAISMGITFFVRLYLIRTISKKYYFFTIESPRILLLCLYAVLTYIASLFLFESDRDSIIMNILSIFSFVLFPVLAWYGGVVSNKNKIVILSYVQTWIKDPLCKKRQSFQ